MPFTPYHFGPSTLVGLVFRKYIDLSVFVLVNVVVDVEVLVITLFKLGGPPHRYFHTLLIGTVVGAGFGVLAYAAKPFFNWAMRLLKVPYQTGFLKMIASGILGVWLHVIIDAIYHWQLWIFWPSRTNPLYHLIGRGQIKAICVACFFAAFILYLFITKAFKKK